MKRSILTPDQAAWLAATTRRNRTMFGGFRMEDQGDSAGTGSDGGGDDTTGSDGDKPAGDGRAFPENTPVSEMTADQKAAYWEHQSKRHESRNRDLLKITGGRYGDQLRQEFQELESLRDRDRTDGERAVEDAKNQTRAEVRKEFGTKLVRAEFRAALAHVDGERRDQIIEGLHLERYLTDNGDVDTDKVIGYASTIAPTGKDTGNQRDHDYGGGRRHDVGGARAGSVAAVMAERRAARETQ